MFQETQPKKKIMAPEIPGKPCERIRTNIFLLKNTNYLCIVYYHSTFPDSQVHQKIISSPTDKKLQNCITEYGLLKKLMSDADINFILEDSKNFVAS